MGDLFPGSGERVFICVLSLRGKETNSLHRWEANPRTKILSCGTNFLRNFENFQVPQMEVRNDIYGKVRRRRSFLGKQLIN